MVPRFAALSLLAVSSGTFAADVPRQPTSKWIAEFAESQCLLSRAYGTDANQLVLSFEQYPMDEGISLSVFKSSSREDMRSGRARIQFGIASEVDTKFWAYFTTANVRRIYVTLDDDAYKSAATSEVISISAEDEIEESFAVPGYADALKVLHQCVVDLGQHWGISADEQRRIAKPAKAVKKLGTYFSGTDYPMQALRNEESGRTNVRIVVDATGRPTDCVVMKRSGSTDLDRATCRILLRRAKFEPAIDTSGNPVKSVVVMAVNWLIAG